MPQQWDAGASVCRKPGRLSSTAAEAVRWATPGRRARLRAVSGHHARFRARLGHASSSRAASGHRRILGQVLDISRVFGRDSFILSLENGEMSPDSVGSVRMSPENARGVRMSPKNKMNVRMLPGNTERNCGWRQDVTRKRWRLRRRASGCRLKRYTVSQKRPKTKENAMTTPLHRRGAARMDVALASIPRFRQQQLRCHIQAIREALQFF